MKNVNFNYKNILLNANSLFENCTSLENVDLTNVNKINELENIFKNCKKLKNVSFKDESIKVKSMRGMFMECDSLETFNLKDFNLEQVKDFSYMFYGCNNLKQLDLSNMDLKSAENFRSMFYGCNNLISLNLENCRTPNLKNMEEFLSGCNNLEEINFTNFNTSNVETMKSLFFGCIKLKNLNLSSFDTSKVSNMNSMFLGCKNLKELDLSNFITTSVIDMSFMFYNCKNLIKLDLTNFNLENTNKTDMFLEIGPVLIINNYDNLTYEGCEPLKLTIDEFNYFPQKVTKEEFNKINTINNLQDFAKNKIPSAIDFINNYDNSLLSEENTPFYLATNGDKNIGNSYSSLFNIIYNCNGGIGNVESEKVKYNEVIKLKESGFSKKGYTLVGWNRNQEQANQGIVEFNLGSNYTINEKNNITLYAVWGTNSYTYSITTCNGNYQQEVRNGGIAGSESDDAYPIRGFVLKNQEDVFNYSASISNFGWKTANTNEKLEFYNNNLEAIRINLKGEYQTNYDIYYRVKTKGFGWLGWTSNGQNAGSVGYDDYIQAIQIQIVDKNGIKPISESKKSFINTNVQYKGQIQNLGWQDWLESGVNLGTEGLGLRLESMQIKLVNNDFNNSSILYQSHVQNVGWEANKENNYMYKQDGETTGSVGKGFRIEATQIKLDGEISQYFDIYYRTQVENTGWLDWAKNDEKTGSARYARRIETIQIKLVPKGLVKEFLDKNPNPNQNKPQNVNQSFIEQQSIWYETHNAFEGWKEEQKDGNTAGSALNPIESLKINIDSANTYQGAIKYRVKETNGVWSDTKQNGEIAGTIGAGKTLEAFSVYIEEGSKLDQEFDVYYRALVDGEWLGYAKNGQVSGYEGKKITAISIMLVPKIIEYDHNEAYKNINGEYVIINKEDI